MHFGANFNTKLTSQLHSSPWVSDLDGGGRPDEPDGVEALPDADADVLVEVELVPLPVDPELARGGADPDLVRDAVQREVGVLVGVERQHRHDGGVAVDRHLLCSHMYIFLKFVQADEEVERFYHLG